MVQCADTASMARGCGSDCASACHAEVASLGSIASIGEPWEMKSGGKLLTNSSSQIAFNFSLNDLRFSLRIKATDYFFSFSIGQSHMNFKFENHLLAVAVTNSRFLNIKRLDVLCWKRT